MTASEHLDADPVMWNNRMNDKPVGIAMKKDTIYGVEMKISYFCQCSVNSKWVSPCKLIVV